FSDAGKVVRFAEGSGHADVESHDEQGESALEEGEGSDTEATESKGTFKGVRPMGRTASGVRGIRLAGDDKVVSLIIPRGDGPILTVTANGYGKRTELAEYPTKSRGTLGVVSIKVSDRNGPVVGAIQVEESNEIMLITNGGILVRTRVQEVSLISRNTAGARLIRTGEDEQVVGLQRIEEPAEDDELIDGEGELEAQTDEAADAQAEDNGNDEQQDPDAEA
ncbi:MAG: DNA gyrase C-terminal beta-propeller domain-containing protein, partial [Oceanisphaera sp.]|nr:DNA gyrase C-terminal beta-propeller domain-containing protein [Oceanisphaera sp.]